MIHDFPFSCADLTFRDGKLCSAPQRILQTLINFDRVWPRDLPIAAIPQSSSQGPSGWHLTAQCLCSLRSTWSTRVATDGAHLEPPSSIPASHLQRQVFALRTSVPAWPVLRHGELDEWSLPACSDGDCEPASWLSGCSLHPGGATVPVEEHLAMGSLGKRKHEVRLWWQHGRGGSV